MALISTMMESSASLLRMSIARDANQGVTQPSYTVLQTNIPCSQQEQSDNVRALYAQRDAEAPTVFYFPMYMDAQPNDVLVVTDRTGTTSSYFVQGGLQPVGRGRLWYVSAVRQHLPTAYSPLQ
jgi:hypothetical protein